MSCKRKVISCDGIRCNNRSKSIGRRTMDMRAIMTDIVKLSVTLVIMTVSLSQPCISTGAGNSIAVDGECACLYFHDDDLADRDPLASHAITRIAALMKDDFCSSRLSVCVCVCVCVFVRPCDI